MPIIIPPVVKGEVTDSRGNAVNDARINLYSKPTNTLYGFDNSDEFGKFEIPNVVEGDYVYEVQIDSKIVIQNRIKVNR